MHELERVLRDAQEQKLAGTAQAIATALHDRPALFAQAARRRRARSCAGAQRRERGRRRTGAAEIAQILQGMSRTTARILVVDRQLDVLARAGSLQRPRPRQSLRPKDSPASCRRSNVHARSALCARPRAADGGVRRGSRSARRSVRDGEVDGALAGILTTDPRPTRDGARRRRRRASDLGRRPRPRRGDRRGDDERRACPDATAHSVACSRSCSPSLLVGRSR